MSGRMSLVLSGLILLPLGCGTPTGTGSGKGVAPAGAQQATLHVKDMTERLKLT